LGEGAAANGFFGPDELDDVARDVDPQAGQGSVQTQRLA
jgi:hypothetical protein